MTVLRLTAKLALVKLGCMLESLSIPHYSPLEKGSDNVMGADDQQERPVEFFCWNPQRLYARLRRKLDEDRVRPAWRHAEAGRNDRLPQHYAVEQQQ